MIQKLNQSLKTNQIINLPNLNHSLYSIASHLFFAKDKTDDIKLDPNLKLQKDFIAENEFDEINKNSKFDLDNQKSQKNQRNEIHFNLNQKVETSENDTNNFDLFNNKNQRATNNHQADLTEIEQVDKDIDEKVLEIPAFLRRQAN